MKALKEKRIRLRSLWRRSLVILSLLALVFAACGGSSSDDNDGNFDALISITTTNPTAKQYMGLPLDLTGVKVTSVFASGKIHVHENIKSFRSIPPVVYGYYNYTGLPATDLLTGGAGAGHGGSNLWLPERNYKVYVNCGECGHVCDITIGNAYGISRHDLVMGYDDWYINNESQHITFAQGSQLNVYGEGRQTYYVDEDPVFDGFQADALYEDGTRQVIPLSRHVGVWHPNQAILRPLYNNGAKNSGSGYLYLTIGRHPDYNAYEAPNEQSGFHSAAFPAYLRDSGLTVIKPLSTIHHVAEFGFETPPNFGNFFYWMDDDYLTWRDRSANVVFRVDYTNGTRKTWTAEELASFTDVWYNENLGGSFLNDIHLNYPGLVSTIRGGAFWIAGIDEVANWGKSTATTHFFNNKAPRIEYYYRGYRLPWDVPVYTRFMTFTVAPTTLDVDMKAGYRDNDNISEGKKVDDIEFSKMFTSVKARYSAYSDPSKEAEVDVRYASALSQAAWNDGTPGQFEVPVGTLPAYSAAQNGDPDWKGGFEWSTVYGMNFGANDTPYKQDPGYDAEVDSYPDISGAGAVHPGQDNWGVCDNPANNNKTRAVRLWYIAPEYAWPRTPLGGAEPILAGPYVFEYAGRTASTNVSVNWTGVE